MNIASLMKYALPILSLIIDGLTEVQRQKEIEEAAEKAVHKVMNNESEDKHEH